MTIATAVAAVVVFAIAFRRLAVLEAVEDAVKHSQHALETMRNQNLDQRAQEVAVQRASLRLLRCSLSIVGRAIIVVGCAYVPVWLNAAVGWTSTGAVLEFLSDWTVLSVGSVVVVSAQLIWARLWPSI